MICANCKTPIADDARNFGIVTRAGVIDLCSTRCKSLYRRPDPATPKPTLSAAKARRGDRKLSPSEVRRKMRPKEGDISRTIAETLDGRGIWNTRTQSGKIKTASGHVMKLCREGTPDRIAAPGLHVWIEVKRPGDLDRTSPEQRKIIEELKRNGSLAFIIDDAEDLNVILRCIKGRGPTIEAIANEIRGIQNEIDLAISRDREFRQTGRRGR